MHRALLVASLLSVAWACTDRVDASLLELHGFERSTVEVGEVLRIRGAGLPPGRAGEISFDGATHRPGRAPLRVSARASGIATTSETVTLLTDDALVRALGGHGTFVGTVRLAIAGAEGRAFVTGALDEVELEVRGSSPLGVHALALARRGRTLLDRVGVTLDDEAAPEVGIAIAQVRDGSPAARAGARPGDAVVSVGAVHTSSIEDCAPPPGASSIDVQIRRPERAQPIDVHVALAPPTTRGEPALVVPAAMLLGVMLFVLLTFSPAARLTAAWALAVRRRSKERRAAAPARPWTARRAFGATVAVLTAVAALGVVPLTARVFPRACDVVLLASVALFAQVLAAIGEPGPRLPRALRLGAFVLAIGPVVAALVLASGTASIPELVEAQGALPWEWRLARDPIALPALAAAIAGGLAPRTVRPTRQVVEVAERIRVHALAALAVSAWLGGYAVPSAGGDVLGAEPVLRIVAVVVFVVKAAALVRIADGLAANAPREAPRLTVLALGLGTLAAAAALFALGAPDWTGRFALAAVLGAVAALGVELVVARRVTRPHVALFV